VKKPQQSLKAWTAQKWRTKSGKKSSETGERYLPESAIKALSPAEYAASRISVSTYSSIPSKLSQGRPIQAWIDRQAATPTVTLWPVPDNTQPYQFVYWRLKRIDDAGNGVNTMDVPFRFLPCMTAGLAYYLALKVPGGPDRLQILKQQYDEAWELAATEDREKASYSLVPRYMSIG
jgi:hypothetical protein